MRSATGCLNLPSGVLERLPFLKEERSLFFDFGHMLFPPPSVSSGGAEMAAQKQQHLSIENMAREPIVAVITENALVCATFPRATRPPRIIPHDRVAGVSKHNEDRITIHVNGEADLHVYLPKGDTFVVYLVDLQDRAMGRSMHFANKTSASTTAPLDQPTTPAASSAGLGLTAAALHAAEEACNTQELRLGVIRFGRASKRTERPPREEDEGSDASSVATIDHEVAEERDTSLPDFPLVAVDATSMRRRLFYFFQHYDRSKLPHIEAMLQHYRGRETQHLMELEARYGPEPNKARWETRDQIAHQRRLRDQLSAQLKRAKDELLLLAREEGLLTASTTRVAAVREELTERLRDKYLLSRSRMKAADDITKDATDADDPTRSYSLLCVTRLLHSSSNAAGNNNNMSSLDNQYRMTTESHAYWLASSQFFDFVKEQAEKVNGATLPPLCVLTRVVVPSSSTDTRRASSSQSAAGGPTVMSSTPQGESFHCNWSFLAGWALEFGAHSVAVFPSSYHAGGDASTTTPVQYMRSQQFWKS